MNPSDSPAPTESPIVVREAGGFPTCGGCGRPVTDPDAPRLIVSGQEFRVHMECLGPPQKKRRRVEFRCGHKIPCRALASGNCSECAKNNRINRAKLLVRKQKRTQFPPTRLPAGSSKLLEWTGAVWRGRLTVPGINVPFRIETDTEIKCAWGLHTLYMQHLDGLRPPTPSPK